jgi:plastocyanin
MDMKRGLIALVALLAVPVSANAQGTVAEIETGDDFFRPESVRSDVGVQSVRWAWATESEHNVLEENGLFESGSPSKTGDFTVTPSAGTFNYYCVLHGFISTTGKPAGMAGQIAVKPTATPQGKNTLVTWATEATDTGTRYDVRQALGSKKPKLVEENTKAIEDAFELKRGKTYTFQVRSRLGKIASRWSPKLKVKG